MKCLIKDSNEKNKKHEKHVKEMKKEINDLNKTIDDLIDIDIENNNYQLKGRSILKSFSNHIYLIFGINYELDNTDK